ncbi:MAG: acyl-CoA dehydrogenase family protein [Myxococcales bacterium]|nr:acyl-CoA dehydrogenase family protein [Myxococcales bacterium]
MAYLFESHEHASLRAQIRRFAEREVAPYAHAWDEASGFPRERYRKGAAARLLGVGYSEPLGAALHRATARATGAASSENTRSRSPAPAATCAASSSSGWFGLPICS